MRPQSSFGTTGGFKLDSTFKNDGTAKDDLPKPAQTSGFGFATGFEELLSEPQPVTSPTHDKEEDMSDGEDAVSEPGEVLEKAAGYSPISTACHASINTWCTESNPSTFCL